MISIGIILCQTIAILINPEKMLASEGCNITRVLAPIAQNNSRAIDLRFLRSNTHRAVVLLIIPQYASLSIPG